MTLVASSRPPKPDLEQQHVGRASRAKSRSAAAVVISKTVIGAPALTASQRRSASTSASSSTKRPPPIAPSRMRSWKRTRCGEV